MLLYFKITTKKNEANKKKINRQSNGFMGLNFLPGLFHFLAPVDVVKNKNRIISCPTDLVRRGCFTEKEIKIFQRGFFPMITINKKQINNRQPCSIFRNRLPEIAYHNFNIF